MKKIFSLLMALCLSAMMVNANAEEKTLWNGTYVDGVELNAATFKAGDVLRVYVTVPESGANFKICYKGESNGWSETTIPSIGEQWPWVNGDETYKEFTLTAADITALTGMNIYIYKGENSTITKVTLDPCTDTKLVEAEDYIDGFSAYHFPNGSPQIESDVSLSNGKCFCFNGDNDEKDGEINFYVYLPAATYSIEIKHSNGKDKYLNIYSEDPDGKVTYNTVKYKKMSAYNPNLGDDYCGDWKTFTYNNVELTTAGYYLIGLYGRQYAKFDYIKFTANTGVFCPNTITMQKNGDESADNPTSSPASAAMAGTEVTITAGEASANHYFSGWTVLPENAVSFANQTNATTTFVMPAEDVTITANYTTCTQHTVTLTAGANGSVSGGGLQCDGSVTVTATPNSDYRFVNWTNTTTSEVVSTDAEYTFNLSADISLTANFEVDPCSSSLTIEVEGNYAASEDYSGVNYPNDMIFVERDPSGSKYVSSCHGSGYVNFQGSSGGKEILIPVNIPVIGSYKVKAYAGQNKDMYINIYATTATDQGSITYKSTTYYKQKYKQINVSNDSETFVESEYTDAVELPTGVCLIGLYGGWSHSVWDQITITRTDGTAFCPNTITMQKSGDASADDPTSSPVNTAMAGVEVTVTAGEPSDANHYFSGWTVLPVNAVSFANPANATTTFVMPAEDVTITANYGAVVWSALNFAAGEGGSVSATAGGNAINSGDAVASGTSVTLTAGANSNYVFINWTDNNNNSNAVVSTNAKFTFSMPATATAYTANFAQIDNVIITGTSATVIEENGDATLTVTSVSDFDAFNHNVLKFAYSNMEGKYKGQKVAKDAGYSSASSAGATGFGFYYKTEKADDHVAFCFDPQEGQEKQVKWQLAATNNVWKYVYIPRSEANSWNRDGIIIYMNGDDTGNYSTWNGQGTHTTYKSGGAFYMSEIAATSITSKPDIAAYHYTYNRDGAMKVNDYGTLCLPMAGTIEGATLYSVAGKEESDNTYIVLEDKGTAVEAGKPYITQSTATSYTVTMSGVHSDDAQAENGLVGTYELIDLTPYAESGTLNYILYDNAFKKAGDNVTVGAYRAYLNWGEVSAAPAQAPGARRIRMVIEGTNSASGLEDLINDQLPKTTKVLIDGQLFIIREGKRYTLTGARAQ